MPTLPRLIPALLLTSCFAFGCSHTEEGDKTDKPAQAEPEKTATTPPEPAAEEPAPEEPAPEQPAADAKVEQMSFVPGELSDKEGKLEHCLDCNRKSATYNYCRFDKDALAAAVGADNMAKTVTAKVEMVEQSSENSTPDDPNAAQPDGGFTHNYFACKVTEVVSAE